MTPWEFRCAVEGYKSRRAEEHDRAAWFMWHAEYLARVKVLPKLDKFLSTAKNTVKKLDESAIKGSLRGYQKEREKLKAGNNGSNS